jgi:hypothetical protein
MGSPELTGELTIRPSNWFKLLAALGGINSCGQLTVFTRPWVIAVPGEISAAATSTCPPELTATLVLVEI